MSVVRPAIAAVALICASGTPLPVLAQTQPAPAPAAAPAPASQLLKAEELDALLAPVALYSDTLLSEVLMASTYPLEVVEASRWAADNKNLKGDALKDAVGKQAWDDSVKSLVATPSVLDMMSTKLSWTQKLGDAVLAQQPDVMDAVQRLRAKAQAQNKLQSTKEQKVSTKTESNKQVIVIEPTQPDTVYVPYYNPAVVYGSWPYAAYPPYYFPPPGYIAGTAIATGIAFGVGVAVGAAWGGAFNWGGNNINVNRNVNINNIGNNNNWQHNPAHRQGVRYNNADVANKFNKGGNIRNGAQDRIDFRGRDGQQVLRPGGDRPGGGDRPNIGGGGDRPNIGDRGGNRPGGGDRPNIGDRGGNRPGGGDRPNIGGGNRPGGGYRPNIGGGGRGGGGRDNAFSGAGGGGRAAMAQSNRGRASMGGGGGGMRGGGGAAMRGGGGGGFHGGGGGRGGGGRRSDAALKHDIQLIGHLDGGFGFYRFSYYGSDKAYVGVLAQEVQAVKPEAVTRGRDGYLRVHYEKLGVKFQTYEQWLAAGAHVPAATHSPSKTQPGI